MTEDIAKAVETDRELELEELDAANGGVILPEPNMHIYKLNPQPLPP